MEPVILRGRYVRDASRLACERAQGKRNRSVAAPESYDGPSAVQRDFIGLLAEFAVADYFQLQVDTRSEKDPGYDFVVTLDGERVTLDVKGFRHRRPRLLVSEGGVKADYYIHSRVNLRDCCVDCTELEYRITPNELILERQEQATGDDSLSGVSLEENVVVDLLGYAPKERVLKAPVKIHESDPSHTLRQKELCPVSEFGPVERFDGHSHRWFS